MDTEDVAVAAVFIILRHRLKKPKSRRRVWIPPYLNRRASITNLDKELILDKDLFQNFTGMSKSDFEYLLNIIGPRIEKGDTNMKKARGGERRKRDGPIHQSKDDIRQYCSEVKAG